MKLGSLAFLVLFPLLSPLAMAQAPVTPTGSAGPALSKVSAADYRRTEDVVYGRKFGVALTMDVFEPTGPSNGYAVIALVSGGWKSSHDNIGVGNYAPYLTRGYTVFAVVHGSQPKFILDEIVPDIHRAVRYIRYHAARWKVDPNKLAVTGASAGGHLSLTLATQGAPGDPEAKDPVDRASSAVQAVACFYPPTDFLNYGGVGLVAVAENELKAYRPAFGADSDTPEGRLRLGKQFSPARYVTTSLPPVLIVHGDADKLVPLQQSEWFVEKAKEAGVGDRVRLIVKPGAAHGWQNSGVEREAFAVWFDEKIRGVTDPKPAGVAGSSK